MTIACTHCSGPLDVTMTCEECGAVHLVPHPGPQTEFVQSRAKITIFGGARGGGKSHGMLLRPVMNGAVNDPGFTGLILRREKERLRGPGGIWEASKEMYRLLSSRPNENFLFHKFPSGAQVGLSAAQYEHDTEKLRGRAFVWVAIEEGTEWTWKQFLDLLRVNRPTSSSRTTPWVDITVNPSPDSWLLDMVRPFIFDEGSPQAGFPNLDECGRLKWFTVKNEELVWVDEDWRDEDGLPGTSVTYIPSSVDDNPTIIERDPTYKANLKAQRAVDVARDLKGNWFARDDSSLFGRARINWIEPQAVPDDWTGVRYWDLAATERKKAERRNATSGTLAGFATCPSCAGWRYVGEDEHCPTCNSRQLMLNGEQKSVPIVEADTVVNPERLFVWVDLKTLEGSPNAVKELVRKTALEDGPDVPVAFEEEAGSSGKYTIESFEELLPEFDVVGDPPKGSKEVRTRELVTLAERGLLWIVRDIRTMKQIRDALRDFPKRGRDEIDSATGCHKVASEYNRSETWLAI